MKDLLKDLNEAQQTAVQETEGPSMIIAGPGSGKTRVLVHKIAWLISNGVDSFRILALTFTNKAANEMKERIKNLIGAEALNLWMGTFHSVFARILRIEAEKIGYTRNFTIYDTVDSKRIISQILKENIIDAQIYPLNYVLWRISSAKMNLINPENYNFNSQIQAEDMRAKKPLLGQIYQTYWNRCRRANAMDFDDILYNMNLLLREFPEAKEKYQKKFQYILIDEFQDTCFSQYVIIKTLSQHYRNVCVVGDDAQGIYGFRGAKIENILNFNKDYPDCRVMKLEQNYRSSKNIVNAANSVISNNHTQLSKTIWTENDAGEKIKIIRTISDHEEAMQVAQDIFQTKMNFQADNSDFAIFYRTNAQSRALEEALRRTNIPYRVYGSLSFYKRKEIKDLMAYFRLTVNNNDEDALLRIINIPARGIGDVSLNKIVVFAHENGLSLWDVVSQIKKYRIEISAGIADKVDVFGTLIKSFNAQLETKNAYDLALHISKASGYINMLKSVNEPETQTRLENIDELFNGLKVFCENAKENDTEKILTLSDFLLEVSLLTDLDDDKDNNNKVSLMTAHSAKGLEFPYVYITGLEENLFPSSMAITTRAEIEEERRLFYVALTRGMKRITLTHAESRFRWGKREFTQPSRFLEEIPEKYMEKPRKKEFVDWSEEKNNYENVEVCDSELRFKKQNFEQKSFSSKTTIELKKINQNFKKVKKANYDNPTLAAPVNQDEIVAGVNVEHEKYGKGKVLQVDGAGNDKKAVVFFPVTGKKQLLLKFAKLKIIN